MSSERFPSIIVFDVNETLLDIDTLTPFFTRVFGKQNVLREWFAQLVLYSQTMTLSGLYTPFGEIGVGALQMIADIRQVTLTASDIDEFKERMNALPAHPDAAPSTSPDSFARCRISIGHTNQLSEQCVSNTIGESGTQSVL